MQTQMQAYSIKIYKDVSCKITHKTHLLSQMTLLAQTAPGTLLLTISVEGVFNWRICQSSTVVFQGLNLAGLICLLSGLISEVKN